MTDFLSLTEVSIPDVTWKTITSFEVWVPDLPIDAFETVRAIKIESSWAVARTTVPDLPIDAASARAGVTIPVLAIRTDTQVEGVQDLPACTSLDACAVRSIPSGANGALTDI